MSRTIRRNNKKLIRMKLGHPQSLEMNFFGRFDLSGGCVQWVEWHPRYENDMAFKRAVSRFKSDMHDCCRTAPRWFKREEYIRPERHAAKLEIKRCMDQNDFDDHQDPHYRGANAWWHWIMT
jgi:hypothetical protein